MMTVERFEALAEAYGAELRRWPADERAAAARLCAERPDLTRALLAEAGSLDALMDAAPRVVVGADLHERVLAAAPQPRFRSKRTARPSWLPGWSPAWSLGAGWAAAACAGVISGVILTDHLTADLQAEAILFQAGLVPIDDTEVLG